MADQQNNHSKPITSNKLSVKALPAKQGSNPITPNNQLKLFVEKELELEGVGMGVLSDGTAFLAARGLARLCLISNARLVEMEQNWGRDSGNTAADAVKALLRQSGVKVPATPHIAVFHKGQEYHAYPDYVCLAVLEYYAFDAPNPSEQARHNFRRLAGRALHDFICLQVGYDPSHQVPNEWRQFHDRMSLVYNAVPAGYFSVFKEIADIIVHLGQNGLTIDESFVPDISVGRIWSDHWKKMGLDTKFGDRRKYDHNYPEYFPQAVSNPQDCWCYPEAALGEFRRWVREDYIGGGRFERYLEGQVEKRQLPPSFAQLAVAAFADKDAPKQIEGPKR